MDEVNLGLYFLSELVGTGMLVLLGAGVVANVILAKSKGLGGGTLMINWDGASRSSRVCLSRCTPARSSTPPSASAC